MKVSKIEKVGKLPVYDLSVADAQSYVTENGVVSHNTGAIYGANDIWIMGRQQEKDGTEVSGYNFIINVEKSRFVKEKSRIPVSVSFDGGVDKLSGIFDMALEGKYIISPNKGWYALASKPEIKFRKSDVGEVLRRLVETEKFQEFVRNRYKLTTGSLIKDDGEIISSREDDIDYASEEEFSEDE